MLDLNRLRMFVAVARHLNFGRAALELAISSPTLSEHIRKMESDLGSRLFNRSTRSVALTEAGARLLAEVEPAMAAIGQALSAFGDFTQSLTGTLRINGPRPALELRLQPLMIDFVQQHPNITVELVVDDAFTDVVAAGFDAGIRYAESLAQDVIAIPLGGPQRFTVVGSPAYFKRNSRPVHPSELVDRPCVGQVFPRGNRLVWPFERAGEMINITPDGPMFSTETSIQLEAARNGLGMALVFSEYCERDLAAGTLESVLDDWCQPFPGPYLYYSDRRLLPANLRAFVNHLKLSR